MLNALLIEKNNGQQQVGLRQLSVGQLPAGEVLVRIAYSTLNYKDALAITGVTPVVRRYPMVPGIDFSGIVEQSLHPDYHPGDRVLVNGWGLGESHWGGLAEYARVPADFLVPVPASFSLRDAMIIGTAGYTAMLCVLALEQQGITPQANGVLVTGAAGGVGSIAVAILAQLGYSVTAMTGRIVEVDYLKQLGAIEVIDRTGYTEAAKPLIAERWAAAVDVAGGNVLANVCAAMRYRGVVVACGLADSMALPTTMAPFILRAVKLIGIDSVMCPKADRLQAWSRLAVDLDPQVVETVAAEISLTQVTEMVPLFLQGQVRGRLVVAIDPTLDQK